MEPPWNHHGVADGKVGMTVGGVDVGGDVFVNVGVRVGLGVVLGVRVARGVHVG